AARFRPAPSAPPPDWPRPAGRAPSPPVLWLRYDDSPPELPLRVETLPRVVSTTTTLSVRIDRPEADVQQETDYSAPFGPVGHLDLTVPDALAGRWDVEGVVRRTDL